MTFSSFKSHIIVGLLMIVVINLIGTYFNGQVVAILPFEPFSLMRGITHRNIVGENYYEAAYLFLYILTAFIWRNNIKKIFGKYAITQDLNHQNQQYHFSSLQSTNQNDIRNTLSFNFIVLDLSMNGSNLLFCLHLY